MLQIRARQSRKKDRAVSGRFNSKPPGFSATSPVYTEVDPEAGVVKVDLHHGRGRTKIINPKKEEHTPRILFWTIHAHRGYPVQVGCNGIM